MTVTTDTSGHESGDYPRCGGRTRAGGLCPLKAGFGTGHVGIGRCKFHGGNTPSHVSAAKAAIARAEVGRLGLPRAVDPGTALLEELHRSAGAVAYLDAVVGDTELDSALMREWNAQRKQHLDVIRVCISAGIAEARIQLEQDKARMVAFAVSVGLDAAQATDEQRAAFTSAFLGRLQITAGGES